MSNLIRKKEPRIRKPYVANTMFFPAILLLTISLTVYGNWKIGIFILLVVLIRIIYLRSNMVWLLMFFAVLSYFGALAIFNSQITSQQKLIGDYTGSVIFYPDNVQIRGNLLTGKGQINYHGRKQTVTMLITVTNQAEQKWLVDQIAPIKLQGSGNIEAIGEPTNFNQFNQLIFTVLKKYLINSRFKTLIHYKAKRNWEWLIISIQLGQSLINIVVDYPLT